jgi:hypothetical protein
MVPIVEAVAIPFITNALQDGRLLGDDRTNKGAWTMLDELLRWPNALAVLRR